jgi:disulfide bond formation protein DsbB
MTWIKHLLAIAVLSAVMLAGCGGGDDGDGAAAPSDDGAGDTTTELVGSAEDGEALFTASCTACHGPDAKGLEGLGKDLTTGFVPDSSDADVISVIALGRAVDDPENTTGVAMLPKGGNPSLTDEDIASILVYLRTLS